MEKTTRASKILDEIERKRQNGEPTDMVLLEQAIKINRIETAECLERGKHWAIHFEKEKREIVADLSKVGKRMKADERKALVRKCIERIEKF